MNKAFAHVLKSKISQITGSEITPRHSITLLFYRYGLRQISWFIYVAAAGNGSVVGQ